MNTHSDSLNYECNICKERFKTSSNLSYHKTKHNNNESTIEEKEEKISNKKTFKCGQCEETFASKTGYKNHMSVAHSDERPFECEICHKSFQVCMKNYLRLMFCSGVFLF